MKDDTLSITKSTYFGNQLKLNGYYYYKYGIPMHVDVYFFYNNGIVLYGSTFPYSEITTKENDYTGSSWIATVRKIKYYWGVFKIEGTTLKFERWHPSSGGPLQVYVRVGSILNDTTFTITESYRMKDGQKAELSSKNETFHFKVFSPKADSANNFIK